MTTSRCPILIVGAGGFGRALRELVAESPRFQPVGFVDDRWPSLSTVDDLPVVGSLAELPALRALAPAAVVALGNNGDRARAFSLAVTAGYELPAFIHARAWVSRSAQLGRGVIVMAAAVVSAHAIVEDGVIINAGAVVDHDAKLGAFCRLGVGTCVEGGAVVMRLGVAAAGPSVALG